jgi:hypothetical protein
MRGGAVKARWHPRRGAAARGSGGTEDFRPGRPARCGRWDGHAGPMRQWRIERRHRDRRRESKENAHFCNYANGARGLSGWGRPVGVDLQERRGQWEPAGPKAEWAARSAGPKAWKKNF